MSFSSEQPFTALGLDPELVNDAKRDPDTLRELAKLAFKTIVKINHPDRGGDGSLIDPATEAMGEINEADDSQLYDLVEEYEDLKGESEVGYKDYNYEDSKGEKQRREDEIVNLFEIARLAPAPEFKLAFIELGQSELFDDNLFINKKDIKSSEKAKFVLIDDHLKGSYMNVTAPLDDADYGADMKSDGLKIDSEKKLVTLNAYENIIHEDQNKEHVDDLDSEETPVVLKIESSSKYNAPTGSKIFGVVERSKITIYQDGNAKKGKKNSALQIAASEDTEKEQLYWLDIGGLDWLKDIKPVSSIEDMEDKYIILANQSQPKIAILGLCRKII